MQHVKSGWIILDQFLVIAKSLSHQTVMQTNNNNGDKLLNDYVLHFNAKDLDAKSNLTQVKSKGNFFSHFQIKLKLL